MDMDLAAKRSSKRSLLPLFHVRHSECLVSARCHIELKNRSCHIFMARGRKRTGHDSVVLYAYLSIHISGGHMQDLFSSAFTFNFIQTFVVPKEDFSLKNHRVEQFEIQRGSPEKVEQCFFLFRP